jgi:hypothetical protein
MEQWRLDVHKSAHLPEIVVLEGKVTGHPRFPTPTTIRTTKLLALDIKGSWGRTQSRFYRLGTSLDGKSNDLGAESVQQINEYVELVKALPKPTCNQMRAFAHHVSKAHSWYKHLPSPPEKAPLYFYLDPGAGMHRQLVNGSMQTIVSDKRGYHYSILPTHEHREKFGYLAFARSCGPSVLKDVPGSWSVPSDETATFYHPERARIYPIPRVLLVLGTCYVDRLLHPGGASSFNLDLGIIRLQGEPAFREMPLADLVKEYSKRKIAASGTPQSVEEAFLDRFIESEPNRQRALMIEACLRVCNFVGNGSFLNGS